MTSSVYRIRLEPRDLVYFLHIPRTGGTSFWEILARQFPPEACRKGGGRRVLEEELRATPPAELARLRLLSGHYDTNITRLVKRMPRFVTMLREPTARTMSQYEIIKQMPRHHLHREVAAGLTFLEFLRHPRGGLADADRQVRQIAGAMDDTPHGRSGPLRGRALLELARERLEEFAFFGILERFDGSIRLLEYTFGWNVRGGPPHRNATGACNHRLRLTARELEACLELNRLDLELYGWARKEFRARLAAVEEAVRAERRETAGEPIG